MGRRSAVNRGVVRVQKRQEEIQILKRRVRNYPADRFGPQGDLVLQKKTIDTAYSRSSFNEVQKNRAK